MSACWTFVRFVISTTLPIFPSSVVLSSRWIVQTNWLKG